MISNPASPDHPSVQENGTHCFGFSNTPLPVPSFTSMDSSMSLPADNKPTNPYITISSDLTSEHNFHSSPWFLPPPQTHLLIAVPQSHLPIYLPHHILHRPVSFLCPQSHFLTHSTCSLLPRTNLLHVSALVSH